MSALDRVHASAVAQPALRVFTAIVRVLLALAFVPSGLVKILDQPFTTLPTSDPVGYFFAAFFSAHGYYRFIGAAQWVAAGLLLVPRTATIGAFLYLPIIVNIFAITLAIGPSFAGTRCGQTARNPAALKRRTAFSSSSMFWKQPPVKTTCFMRRRSATERIATISVR